tara:strand:+ start:300 stop:530 length:231 start_codon:yes stop_codon:yes gene_type:complete
MSKKIKRNMGHMEHRLENCSCGAKKHKQKTLNKWNRIYQANVKSARNSIKRSLSDRKKKKKSPIINVGGEYKDRNR